MVEYGAFSYRIITMQNKKLDNEDFVQILLIMSYLYRFFGFANASLRMTLFTFLLLYSFNILLTNVSYVILSGATLVA